MNQLKRNTLIAGAMAVALAGAAGTALADDHKGKGKKEKCYGIVKAGQNDCGNLAGTHSCVGHAAVDGDPGEWVLVPKGLCEKLVNGKTADEVKKAS